MLTAITREWSKGAEQHSGTRASVPQDFDDLEIGDTLVTEARAPSRSRMSSGSRS
jgi:oxepin-CoA hydrolase / 3-oxo-5,6-dehydrosuberyl-CoA semialdehyde dehydrogenase